MRQVGMKIAVGAALLTGATTFGIGASSVTSSPSLMSRGDHEALKVAIAMEGRDLLDSCDSLRGAERHVCQAETRSREVVLLAELEARYSGTYAAAREAHLTRIHGKYEVDRARCFALAGYMRDSCVVSAHAEKGRALMALKAEG